MFEECEFWFLELFLFLGLQYSNCKRLLRPHERILRTPQNNTNGTCICIFRLFFLFSLCNLGYSTLTRIHQCQGFYGHILSREFPTNLAWHQIRSNLVMTLDKPDLCLCEAWISQTLAATFVFLVSSFDALHGHCQICLSKFVQSGK